MLAVNRRPNGSVPSVRCQTTDIDGELLSARLPTDRATIDLPTHHQIDLYIGTDQIPEVILFLLQLNPGI